MPNCNIQILWIDAVVPVGGLTPTDVRVAVSLANCPGGNAVVRTSVTGQSLPTFVPASGYTFALPVTRAILCDEKIVVEAWCDQDPNCKDTQTLPVACTQCARVRMSAAAGQCVAGQQPVTFTAEIGLQPGQSTSFYMDFDDGSPPGPTFTATNSTATSATVITHVEPPHNYWPGSYTPKLWVLRNPECGPFPIPITVQCAAACPVASNASAIDKGCVSVAGQAKKRRFELAVTVATTPAAANAQWKVRQVLAGGGFGPVITVPAFGCAGASTVGPAAQVPPGPQIVDVDAGDYEATLEFLFPFQNCPGIKINFTAAACPPDCPSLVLATPVVTGCAPGNAVATFNATLSWQVGQSPVVVSTYLWSVEWLDQSVTPAVQRKAQVATPGPTLTPVLHSNDPGWYGTGALGGQLDLGKPGNYTVTVQAVIAGVSPTATCNAVWTSVPPFPVPGCNCPKPLTSGTEWTVTNTTAPLGPNKFQTLACDSAQVQLTVAVDPGSYPSGALVYDWAFPNGTTIAGGGPTQSFTFTNSSPGTTQTHTVTVTVRVPGSTCASFTRTVDVTVPGCTGAGKPPGVTGCAVTAGSSGSGSVSVTFDQDVDKTSAETASNYSVKVGSAAAVTPAAGSVTYDPVNKRATITGLSINPGDTVVVTVSGVMGKTGVPMTAPASPSCIAPGSTGTGSPGGFSWCAFLLVLSIILLLLGALVVIVGVCIAVPWVWIVGAIIGAVGLILFIIWIIICSAITPCSVMQTVHCTLFWIIAVAAPIIVALALIFGGLPCGLAAAAAWGGWGTLYAWLGFIMGRVGCPRIC